MDTRSANIAPTMYMQVQELNIPVQFSTARPARHTPSDTMAEQPQTNFQTKLNIAPSYPSSPFTLHSGEIPSASASFLLAAATLAQARAITGSLVCMEDCSAVAAIHASKIECAAKSRAQVLTMVAAHPAK